MDLHFHKNANYKLSLLLLLSIILSITITTSKLYSQITIPVKLVSFEVHNKKDKTTLIWETDSEINSDGFEIQKSIDADHFEKIGFVKSKTSVGKKQYSFVDKELKPGISYYRLKQLDYDGAFELFQVVSVKNDWESLDFNLFPNPASKEDNLSIILHNLTDSHVTLNVYSVSGLLIHHEDFSLLKGFNTLNIDPLNLDFGTYIVSLESKTRSIQKRIVIHQ